MSFDPYAVLGLTRDATDDEVLQAYERELATAARLGALKAAQEVDRAYTLLRQPHRRAVYDRTGLLPSTARLHPDERYVVPQAVPFRQWSPASAPTRSPVRPAAGSSRAATWLLLVAVLGVLALVGLLLPRPGTGPAPAPPELGEGVCPASGAAPAYVFRVPLGEHPVCADGSVPAVTPVR